MDEFSKKDFTFGSRMRRQSREIMDSKGEAAFVHNANLQCGETVFTARGDVVGTVTEDTYWHPITRVALVKVLFKHDDGTEEVVEMAASKVRRRDLVD